MFEYTERKSDVGDATERGGGNKQVVSALLNVPQVGLRSLILLQKSGVQSSFWGVFILILLDPHVLTCFKHLFLVSTPPPNNNRLFYYFNSARVPTPPPQRQSNRLNYESLKLTTHSTIYNWTHCASFVKVPFPSPAPHSCACQGARVLVRPFFGVNF